ncbi:3-hydroxyisobutyryl-CoA hydrolase, mitochondrial-like [Zophobas morio]|jgi:3-hydroxyisobutyryl-CoA hydrolase|uniref:3-hydroxyisobutyryl-CoA hydrolase, mitochondrial-like n=1 Tax=Zophobas morio TaxID=2755281 RepID=UPI0030830316
MFAVTQEVLGLRQGNLALAKLNRPMSLNALTLNMCTILRSIYNKWDKDEKVKIVACEGVGPKSFCAGGDIKALLQSVKEKDMHSVSQFFKSEYDLVYQISRLTKPYVAILDGITMGGGAGLCVHGRFRIATENTLFSMPETALGLFPDVGAGYFLPRLQGQLGSYLALTGAHLKGVDVYYSGIATHYISSGLLRLLKQELAEANSDQVDSILDSFQKHVEDGYSLAPHLEEINKCFLGDNLEIILQQLENESEWTNLQANIIKRRCPVSCKLAVKILQDGLKMSLQKVLEMDYKLAMRCVKRNDFKEGVNATLINKGHLPAWDPAAYNDITIDMINEFFY